MIIDYWEARVYPVHVEALQMQDNANTWTFDMREGLRWSDGAPFTSADIMFWWNDAVRNEKVTPKLPSYWMVGGEAARVSRSTTTRCGSSLTVRSRCSTGSWRYAAR